MKMMKRNILIWCAVYIIYLNLGALTFFLMSIETYEQQSGELKDEWTRLKGK